MKLNGLFMREIGFLRPLRRPGSKPANHRRNSLRPSHLGALASLGLLLAFPALAQTAAPSVTTRPPASSAAPAQEALIDINTASKEALDKLPQIGSVRAEAIIKGRPYRGKNELVDKKIIPQNAYDAIKDKIIAHHKS